jgi:hypothetical protein
MTEEYEEDFYPSSYEPPENHVELIMAELERVKILSILGAKEFKFNLQESVSFRIPLALTDGKVHTVMIVGWGSYYLVALLDKQSNRLGFQQINDLKEILPSIELQLSNYGYTTQK